MIDLSLGHIQLAFSHARHALSANAAYGVPHGMAALREVIASRHGVPASCVTITTGASLALTALLASRRPTSVLLPRPYYPSFRRAAELLGIECRFYDATSSSGLDTEAVAALMGENRGSTLIWNYPHNPTGVVDTEADRAQVLSAAAENGVEVVHDCVYADLAYDEYCAPHGTPLLQEARIYSLSKTFALAGERIGYVVASEERCNQVARAHWALAMSPPAASQALALELLTRNPERIPGLLEQLGELRDLACLQLATCPELVFTQPAAGIFVWVEVPTLGLPSAVIEEVCRRAGVLVAPGSVFGDHDTSTVRVSFAVEAALLERGLGIFLTVIARLAKHQGQLRRSV